MVKITFVQADGAEKIVESEAVGEPLMEVARSNGVEGIMGDCNGGAECGTCHVFVDPDWMVIVGKPDDVEAQTLDMASAIARENSRLSCQIKLDAKLDGLRLTVAGI